MSLNTPYIPENIVVHLGRPDEDAPNVTIPFVEYIKNIAASELYPTWQQTSLLANIYAIITFALNRIYTEYYRNRGYDFDITNTSQFDQSYQPGIQSFQNVSELVELVFDSYVKKQGRTEPYFTSFCNGTTTQCEGLSQWGTVDLASKGLMPYQILQTYYGKDIDIKTNVPIIIADESYSHVPLRKGSRNNGVKDIQIELNRIRQNYPGIPPIYPVDGIFGANTEAAVLEFQKIFNLKQDGIIGKSTWYTIKSISNAIKKLRKLQSEGLSTEEIPPIFLNTLNPRDKNNYVTALQYYLTMIKYNYPNIPSVEINGIYDNQTEMAVKKFQEIIGLNPTGTVNQQTIIPLLEQYKRMIDTLPKELTDEKAKIYPGYFLEKFFTGEDVKAIQQYLAKIATVNPKIPPLTVNGTFDQKTEEVVRAFQKEFGLPVTGQVGPVTWNKITEIYESLIQKQMQLNGIV